MKQDTVSIKKHIKVNQNKSVMVRHRKVGNAHSKHVNYPDTSSSSGSSVSSVGSRAFQLLSVWKTIIGFVCFLVAVYIGTLGYLETRVNTPFDTAKVVKNNGLAAPDRYWGTYRPGVYFGLKSREPDSPVFGLMWYDLAASAHRGVRHWCDQSDNLATYGWLRHDGVSFGEQLIVDAPRNIITTFLKTPGGEHGGHWTARINVTTKGAREGPFVLVWYGALDEALGPAAPLSKLWVEGGALLGHTPHLNNFKLNFVTQKGKILHKSYSEAHSLGLQVLKEKFYSLLVAQNHPSLGRIAVLSEDSDLADNTKNVNFVPIQMVVETPFVLDIVYTTEDLPTPPLKGEQYTRALEDRKRSFDEEFEEKFKLGEKGYSEEDVGVARAALSNMVGGIGYFYGAGRVQSPYTKEPVPYWRAPLYTAVPSRSFFPRGFLWDEGFHGLLISKWSPDIQLDIAAHWLDLINVEGWIPREQILGAEALARVPKEFVVQSNAAANPPMMLIQLAHLVSTRPQLFGPHSPHRHTLDRMFGRLQAWYQWFQTTQKGEEPTSYRWRGREDDGRQLNPKTLTSGLDDYPRASHPSDIERHVDLRCWMYAAADALTVIGDVLDRDTSRFEAMRDQLSNEDLLNELHWSPHTQTYADYGLHTDGVRLVRTQPKSPSEPAKVVRNVSVPPQPKLVTSAFGYVSLFPMLLKVLKPDSEKLGKILEDLDKPDLLWSPYGLRSLSKSSPLYMKRNTEHDPPYWRGQVWLNVNYLALAALSHYARLAGPLAERAAHLRARLRDNLVRSVARTHIDTRTPPKVWRPRLSQAIKAEHTLGESQGLGEAADVTRSHHGSLRTLPLKNNIEKSIHMSLAERAEAMDLEEEEGEEACKSDHVMKWLVEQSECHKVIPRSCSTPVPSEVDIDSMTVVFGDRQDTPMTASGDTDVQPSTSGMRPSCGRAARICNEGSEFDSDFDDEFDLDESTANAGLSRGIPHDEELDERERSIINRVTTAMDEAVDLLTGVSNDFTWQSDFDTFKGRPEEFSGPTPGPVEDYDTPYDAFTSIWSRDIMEHIVRETNRYANQVINEKKSAGTLKEASRLHRWVDTNVDEMYLFFAIYILMGYSHRTSQSEYWNTSGWLEMPMFRQLITYNRFILLNKFIHFADNNSDVSQNLPQSDGVVYSAKLAKIAPVLSHLNIKFSKLYNLKQDIAIDESLTLFKGRLSWVQGIKSKAARIGIKSYELCESRTGYLWKFIIYTGKDSAHDTEIAPSIDLAGKSTQVVLNLLKGLEYRGHLVTMDNFYNCPALARYLKSLGFDCLGTLRSNRKNLPVEIAMASQNVPRGTIIARHSGDVSCIAWKDNKMVNMISTYHTPETFVSRKGGRNLVKPIAVRDYNNTMGGVNLKDQKLSMYLLERKRCVKFYMKLFKRLLNVSVLNAFILLTQSLARRGGSRLTHRKFREQLADSLVAKHRHTSPRETPVTVPETLRLNRNILHVPKLIRGSKFRSNCHICLRNDTRKRVSLKCIACDEFLCDDACWRVWHTHQQLPGRNVFTRKGRRRN